MKRVVFLSLILFSICGSLSAAPVKSSELIKAPHVVVSWIAPEKISSSTPDVIGLRFKIDPGWHIYWKNSGDSGAPPKFNFKESDFNVGPVQWPIPKRIPVGHLVNIGYENTVVFLFQVSPKNSTNKMKLALNLEWLVCKEECIPGISEISLTRSVVSGESVWSVGNKRIMDEFLKRLPRMDAAPWDLKLIEKSDEKLIVAVRLKNKSENYPDLFPVDGEHVNPQAPTIEKTETEARYTFALPASRGKSAHLVFLAVGDNESWENSITQEAAPVDTAKLPESAGLLSLLFFAFLGGVILNLMPCVLPVLSIKFLSILKASESDRHRDALLYMAGVLTAFFALGSVFLILRSAGAAIGWGFQLQSPYIVLFLILLFWMMALNFLGIFEFGESIMNKAGNTNSTGSFTTGILAVFVAAPCTGPFMGTALGAAATVPATSALGIFLSLGFGLAFPFVLVSFVPSLYKLMPKPGAWMDRLKQFLAFPLLGTVIWLMWVLGIQLGVDGWLLSCTLLLLIALALWLGKFVSRVVKWVATVLLLTSVVVSFVSVSQIQKNAANSLKEEKAARNTGWVNYDRALIDQARAKGQSVFVDFTAAWCITCQLNKKAVLETETVQKIFQTNDVLTMRADWTNQDSVITKALAEFNRNSVPVYLFYNKGAEAQILPQILTIAMIENLFNKKE